MAVFSWGVGMSAHGSARIAARQKPEDVAGMETSGSIATWATVMFSPERWPREMMRVSLERWRSLLLVPLRAHSSSPFNAARTHPGVPLELAWADDSIGFASA